MDKAVWYFYMAQKLYFSSSYYAYYPKTKLLNEFQIIEREFFV